MRTSLPRQPRGKTPWSRFPQSSLGISYIAEQAYCEKRVDLWLESPGELVSIPMGFAGELPGILIQEELAKEGTNFHEAMSEGAKPISRKDLETKLKAGQKLVISEPTFRGTFSRLPLIGRPDAVFFDGNNAACIIEYKYTDSNQLEMGHRVQLLLYGYLLKQSGFIVDDLILVCALVSRHNKDLINGMNSTQSKHFVSTIRDAATSLVLSSPSRKNWYKSSFQPVQNIHIALRVLRYNPEKAENELQFFTNYWLGHRSAIPTKNSNKCVVCLYNAAKLCSVALIPYKGGKEMGVRSIFLA